MENASLRIKFCPILKNVAFNNSKCTIEILPEVSSFQNLDKLEWKMDNGLVEYTIPMTYKIFIKKDNYSAAVDIEKTYHSCVDLLHAYSMSNTNLASGDVTRMISDNLILNKVTSDSERCDILLTKKDFYSSKKSHTKISEVVQKTKSIQTLIMKEMKRSSSTVDRSIQIDIKCESFVVVKKVSETINMHTSKTRNEVIGTQKTQDNFVKRCAVHKKSIKPQRSLSPMCSCEAAGPLQGNTQNKRPFFEGTVSKNNIFRRFVQSLSGGDNSSDSVYKGDNNTYYEYVVLDKDSNMPFTDKSYTQEHKVKAKNDSHDNNPPKIFVIPNYLKLKQAASLNDIINEAQNYDELHTIGVKNFNIIWNPNYNQSKFIELQNTVVTLQGNDYENDHKLTQKSSRVKVISSRVKTKEKDSYNLDTMKTSTNHTFKPIRVIKPTNLELNQSVSDVINTRCYKSRNDHSKNQYAANRFISSNLSKQIPQNSRVSQFDKYIKKEIFPLVSELNNIKNKCISYGLFTNDMVPCIYYYSCKSLSKIRRENKFIDTVIKFDNEIEKSQVVEYSYETSLNSKSKMTKYHTRKKPNRVVYSISFND